ncbi:MAG: PilZ domain-containing protein [Spirochaetales bacterium]|nr:PilZ domain-containing protein [Spirochaetales bacterium]
MSFALTLLQTRYWKESDPKSTLIGLAVLGGIVLLVLLSSIFSGRRQSASGSGVRSRSAGGSRFSHGDFRRAARNLGIVDEHASFLERYARELDVADSAALFRTRERLDGFFKDVYRRIDKHEESEQVAENEKATLFAIREYLTVRSTHGAPVRSSRQIQGKTTLSFILPDQSSHPSVLRSNEPGGLAVEPVLDSLGSPKRIRRGTRMTVFFYPKPRQGYSFRTKVTGYEVLGGRLAMILKHSDSVSALPARRHQRRELRAPCLFRRVAVELAGSGKHAARNVRVERMAWPGTVVDVSAGGLSLQSANPIETGNYVKIEFDPGNGQLAVFGSVVRMNRVRGGGVMHIRFVKISRKAVNELLSFVYGYSD